jgi:hypothetical protein
MADHDCDARRTDGIMPDASARSGSWRSRTTYLVRVELPGVKPGGYAVFSQTDTELPLSLVKGARVQSLQRSRNLIPASRAMRSSSDGQT